MTLRWQRVDDQTWQALLPGDRALIVSAVVEDATDEWTWIAARGSWWSWSAVAIGCTPTAEGAFADLVDSARALGWLAAAERVG